jgi:hypothetical protein
VQAEAKAAQVAHKELKEEFEKTGDTGLLAKLKHSKTPQSVSTGISGAQTPKSYVSGMSSVGAGSSGAVTPKQQA